MFFAPSDRKALIAANGALARLQEQAPVAYEALKEVKKCVVLSTLPWPGGLEKQPLWFRSTVDWLTSCGMLEGPMRGGGL